MRAHSSQALFVFCLFIVTDPGGQKKKQSPVENVFGRQLSEPGRFAYAGLCGVSLGQLFHGHEQK